MSHGMFSSYARTTILHVLRENLLTLSQFQSSVDIKSLSAFMRIVTAENVQVPLELICKSHSQENRGEKLFKAQSEVFMKDGKVAIATRCLFLDSVLVDLDTMLHSIFSNSILDSAKFLQDEIIGEIIRVTYMLPIITYKISVVSGESIILKRVLILTNFLKEQSKK
jgi:hypothetical protein